MKHQTTPRRRRLASEFASMAERRAWVQSDEADTAYDKVGTYLCWPTMERLARNCPQKARLLAQWLTLSHPFRPVIVNDAEAEDTNGYDARLEIRPSVAELLRAAAREGMRTTITSKRTSSGWQTVDRCERGERHDGEYSFLGDLSFFKGELVSWGKTRRGKALKPTEKSRGSRGAKQEARCEEAIAWLIPDRSAVARDVDFLAGVSAGTCDTEWHKPGHSWLHDTGREQERHATAISIRRALCEDVCEILDMALTDATAREIGEQLGYEGKTAERRGIAAIDQSLELFSEKLADWCP